MGIALSAGGPALAVSGLTVAFDTDEGPLRAVDDVSITVERGEVLGLVGESGSGKTVTGLALLGLVDPPGRVVSGSIRLDGQDVAGASERDWRRLRGSRIAMIFQDPMSTLHPALTIGTQMAEAVMAHEKLGGAAALARAADALGRVGIPSPAERLGAYAHQFSGGMRQRVAIATAFMNSPFVIVADEPTTALDVTIQAQILHEMQKLQAETGAALVWITHDLSVVAGLADRIAVMYGGRIVETGPTDTLLTAPVHPYTAGLVASVPARGRRGVPLRAIPGTAPSLAARPDGCPFHPRCDRATALCGRSMPPEVPRTGRHAVRCHHPLDGPALAA